MEHEVIGLELVVLLMLILVVIIWENDVRVNWIPSSVIAVIIGMVISTAWHSSNDAPFVFAPELFLYLLLPIILLNSSFKFNIKSLRKTWMSSLAFSFPGTICSIGMIAWGIRVVVPEMQWIDALSMASILAPTDTVATIMLSKSLDDTFIAEVLENEAVMNDAIAVVFVRLFSTMSIQHQVLNRWIPMRAVGTSILFMCLSAIFGALSAFTMRETKIKNISVHFIVALMVYAICEYVGISGIVGLFVYGSFVKPSEEVKVSITNISVIVEAYVYLTLGLALHTYDMSKVGLSFLILILCITSRVIVVFMIGGCLHLFGRKQWTVRTLLFFSMCGIRGAISFAMCIGLRSGWSSFVQSTTFVVIIFTIITMGTLQKCMQKVLLKNDLIGINSI